MDARKNWVAVLADIKARDIRELVFGGDIGESAANADFFASLASFGPNLRVVLGNHDTFAEVSRHFHRASTIAGNELCYAEDDGALKFLFLDSSRGEISEGQLGWLEKQLKVEKPVVIFMHHRVLAVPSVVDRLYPLKGRERVAQVLRGAGQSKPVNLFCGHYHFADARTEGNIKQFVSPAASFQLNKEAAEFETSPAHFGYRIITIEGTRVDSEVVTLRP